MNARTSLLFAAAILLAGPAVAADFTARPLAAGESWTETLASASDLTITINDSYRTQQRDIDTAIQITKSMTVVSVGANGDADAVQVQYGQAVLNGATLPVTGHTYHLDLRGGQVQSVVYPGGGTPSPEEVEFVLRENRSLDRLSAFSRAFEGIATDTWVDIPKPLAARLINASEDTDIDQLRVKLRSISGTGDDAVADFDAELSLGTPMKKNGADRKTSFAFNGTLLRTFPTGTIQVRVASCRPVSLSFAGTDTDSIAGAHAAGGKPGKHDRMTISGTGSASLEITFGN
jgi:hypothetical protein